jgi:hypothetical protein
MKFSFFKSGQLGLLLMLSVVATGCNPEEYFPITEQLTGEDAFCYEAKDLNSCQALVDRCQPAFYESADESQEPLFVACIANPDYVPADNSGSDNTGTNDGSGTTNGSDSNGSDSNGSGSNGSGSNGSGTTSPETEPTLQEAFKSKCENLNEKYLWIKHEVKKKQVVNTVKKVKVCHSTGNGSAHTIMVACQALKAHSKHHHGEDYLGACYL